MAAYRHQRKPRDYAGTAYAVLSGVLFLGLVGLAAGALLVLWWYGFHATRAGLTPSQVIGLVLVGAGWHPEVGTLGQWSLRSMFNIGEWYTYLTSTQQWGLFGAAGTWSVRLGAIGALAGAFIGWRWTTPGPAEEHVRGRRLSESPQEAARELGREIKTHGAGVLIHPDVRLSLDRETRGLFVLGSPGSGKTQVIKRLLRGIIDRGDRILLWDVKGDYTAALGHLPGVVLLAPWDSRSRAWDVGADVPTRPDARELAARLVRAPKGGNDMWANGARIILSAYIMHVQAAAHAAGRRWTMAALARACSQTTYAELVELLDKYAREGIPLLGEMRKEVKNKESEQEDSEEEKGPNRTAQGFLATLAAYLTPVFDLADAWSAGGHGGKLRRFSVRRWLTDPESVEHKKARIVILQGHSRFPELAASVVQSVIGVLGGLIGPEIPDQRGADAVKTWLILDEAAQLGRVERLSSIIEVGRSKGVRVVIGTQDISQLREAYGEHTIATWASMLGTYVICRSQGRETPDWLSEMVGDRQVRRYQLQSSEQQSTTGVTHSRSASHSWQTHAERVITSDEIGSTLGPGDPGVTALLVCGGAVVYRLLWPYIDIPARVDAVRLAPWVQPGWSRTANTAVTQAAQPATAAPAAPAGPAAPSPTKPQAPPEAESQAPGQPQTVTEPEPTPAQAEPEPEPDDTDSFLPPAVPEPDAQAEQQAEPETPAEEVEAMATKEAAVHALEGAVPVAGALAIGAEAAEIAVDLMQGAAPEEGAQVQQPAPVKPRCPRKKKLKVRPRTRSPEVE